MKKPVNLLLKSAALLLLLAVPLQAAEGWTRFGPKPGLKSKVRIEGTSTIHDWRVESPLVGGYLEVGPNFPLQAGADAKPGKVDARVEAFIPVGSLKSLEKDGTPYSTAMDDIMYEKLLKPTQPKILYRLSELTLKEAPKTAGAAMVFDSAGELVVAGVTNKLTMPVTITVSADKKMKITGTVAMKMTAFKIEPPAPKIALGMIKTGDDVKLFFEWEIVGQ